MSKLLNKFSLNEHSFLRLSSFKNLINSVDLIYSYIILEEVIFMPKVKLWTTHIIAYE